MKPYRGNKVTGFPRPFHIHSLEEKPLENDSVAKCLSVIASTVRKFSKQNRGKFVENFLGDGIHMKVLRLI